MAEKKMFATKVDSDLLKELKHLSVDLENPVATLLEEAIREILKKYKKPHR